MRNLHAGNGPRRRRSSQSLPATIRIRNTQRPGRQSLPLHGLHENFRISRARLSEVRAFVPNYELTTPSSLADALTLLNREPGVWRPFAGGTDLMVLLEAGKLAHRNYVNIWGLNELRGIDEIGRA